LGSVSDLFEDLIGTFLLDREIEVYVFRGEYNRKPET